MQFIEIEAENVRYFSKNDENIFFEWIKKIPCITDTKGRLSTLYLTVQMDVLDDYQMRDILALFQRYQIDMRTLKKIIKSDFLDWINDPIKFWHYDLFQN